MIEAKSTEIRFVHGRTDGLTKLWAHPMLRETWENILTELVCDSAQKPSETRQAKSLDKCQNDTHPAEQES